MGAAQANYKSNDAISLGRSEAVRRAKGRMVVPYTHPHINRPPTVEKSIRPAIRERRQRPLLQERLFMFTAQDYRAKALEYEGLVKTASSPAEISEYRDLQQRYTSFADNLDWMAANLGKTVVGHPGNAAGGDRDKRQRGRRR